MNQDDLKKELEFLKLLEKAIVERTNPQVRKSIDSLIENKTHLAEEGIELHRITRFLLSSEEFEIQPGSLNWNDKFPVSFVAYKKLNSNEDYFIAVDIASAYYLENVLEEVVQTKLDWIKQQDRFKNGTVKLLIVTQQKIDDELKSKATIDLPIDAEIIDINGLKRWFWVIDKKQTEGELTNQVENAVLLFNNRLIELIADNIENLKRIEWRDLERLLADVLDGLGFKVTLTPPSKDGGKDLILQYEIEGNKRSYYVEVKHWKSAKVGKKFVKEFVNVVLKDNQDKGLFISSYGFSKTYVELLSQFELSKIEFAEKDKIFSLCQTYIKRKSGIYIPHAELHKLIFEK